MQHEKTTVVQAAPETIFEPLLEFNTVYRGKQRSLSPWFELLYCCTAVLPTSFHHRAQDRGTFDGEQRPPIHSKFTQIYHI